MNLEKETIISAFIIFFLLVLFTIAGLLYISEIGVKLNDKVIVLITPFEPSKTNSSDDIDIEPITEEKLPGVFGIGYHVIISNTGGDGLRVRSAPGLDSTPLFLGFDNEEFIIIGGPSLIDNRLWWNLKSEQNPDREGWAVQDYLKVKN